jgi:hypothetical protein
MLNSTALLVNRICWHMLEVVTTYVCACFFDAVQLHALGFPAGHFGHIMFDEAGQAGRHGRLC